MREEKQINTGGNAFPVPPHSFSAMGDVASPEYGMTLRDYFAAAALPVVALPDPYGTSTSNTKKLAAWAYELADAMIAAREARP